MAFLLRTLVIITTLLAVSACSNVRTIPPDNQTGSGAPADSSIVPAPPGGALAAGGPAGLGRSASDSLKGKLNGHGEASGGTSGNGNYADGSYDFLIDRYHPVTVHGCDTVYVNGVITGAEFVHSSAYLEIGLVVKDLADAILDDWDWPSYMFNQSAFFVAHTNSAGNLQFWPQDYNGSPWTNDSSWIVAPNDEGKFDCTFSLKLVPAGPTTPGGLLYLSVNGADYGPPVSYGIDNWEMEWHRWFGWPYPQVKEFYGTQAYGFDMSEAYLTAQFYTEHPSASVSAHVNAKLSDK